MVKQTTLEYGVLLLGVGWGWESEDRVEPTTVWAWAVAHSIVFSFV